MSLTKRELAALLRDGYLLCPSVVSRSSLRRWRQALQPLLSNRQGEETWLETSSNFGGDIMRARLLFPIPDSSLSQLRKSRLWEFAGRCARQVLAGSAKFTGAYCLHKPPRKGASTPWHQDAAYLPNLAKNSLLSFWIPLQSTDEDNGCLNFIPRSHRSPLLRHTRFRNDESSPMLVAHVPAAMLTRAVPCPMIAGGLSLHLGGTIHSSGPNLSGRLRTAVILDYFG